MTKPRARSGTKARETSHERGVVVLLRGANTGNQKATSATLRASLQALPEIREATTVAASGNVVVRTDLPLAELRQACEETLSRELNWPVRVVAVRQDELEVLLRGVPWDDDPDQHVYLTFTDDPEVLDHLTEKAVESGDIPDIAGRLERLSSGVLAWTCPKGASTTDPLAKALSGGRSKALITTRNLRTVRRLADVSV